MEKKKKRYIPGADTTSPVTANPAPDTNQAESIANIATESTADIQAAPTDPAETPVATEAAPMGTVTDSPNFQLTENADTTDVATIEADRQAA